MAAPELRLNVTLDLAGFRKELGRVAQAAGAYYYPINLQVNKRNFTRQLENIGRTLGTRTYNVDVDDTSIKTASIQVDKLAEKLKRLSGTININTNIGEAGGRPGTAMAVMARKLANQFKGDIDAAARQMQAIRGEGPFGKGTRSIPGFKAAAQGMGIENAFKLFFQELKTVDPRRLAKALDDGSVMMMQENREIKQSLDAIQDKAKKLASDLSAMGDAAKTTGKASIERAGKALYPQNYGLKIASLLSSVEKLNSDLRKVSAASGVELSDPLNELSSVLRGLSNSFVDIAGFNRTLDETLRGFDTATKRATQATVAYAERIQRRAGTAPAQATAGPRLLSGQGPAGALAVLSREDPYRVIETQVRNAFDIIEDYHKRQAESFANNYKKVIENYHRRTLSSIVRSMQVTDLGGRGRPLLPSGRDPLMLPGAGGTTPIGQMRFNAVTTGVNPPLALPPGRDRVLGQPPFMTAPSIGAPITRRPMGMTGSAPLRGPAGGGAAETGVVNAAKKTLQFKTAMDVAAESTKNLTASQIPLLGGIKNLGAEFGQAAKQVLLYGTAYKGLAFITSLPGQIFNAAKAQQQYNNSLQVVTESTGTYAKELLYVDQIQRTFGLDLQATRKGFTDLYASMAPTGFDSGSIEKLFTGISAASAALQLTPATMDRVIYAFAQMASKGQIMSEELKRQLGDALPGALGIFANAAGMSLQEFNKAMEAGEFTGNKFRETIAKVTDELIDRFGSGAQAAGKSLQGLTNIVKGDFIRTLEALTPLVNSVAQATLIPLGNVLKQFSSATRVAMGEMGRLEQQIEKQKQLIGELEVAGVDTDQIKKARVALLALQADYEKLNIAMEDPATKRQAEQIKQFVAELSRLGQVALNIAGAIGSVLNPVMTFFGLNLSTLVGTIAAVAISFNMLKLSITIIMGVAVALKNLQIALASTEKSLMLLQFGLKMLGVKISMAKLKLIGFGTVLKGLLIASGVGAVLVGLGLLAAAFSNIGNSAKRAAEESKASIQAIKEAVAGGNVALIEMKVKGAKVDIEGLDALSEEFKAQGVVPGATVERRKKVAVSEEQAARALAVGLDLKPGEISQGALNRLIAARKKLRQDELQVGNLAMAPAVARRAALGLEDPNLGVVPEEAGDAEAGAKRAQSLESYYSLQDQLAKNFTQDQIDRMEKEYQARVDRINAEFDLREARANSFQKEAIRYERQISNIELKRQKALLDASNAVLQAQGSVAGGASAGAAGAYLQGNIGPTSTGPHFDVKKMGGGYFPREYLDQYVQVNGKPLSSGTTVPGGTFAAHQNRGSHGWDYAFGGGRHAATLTGGAEWMGGSPTQHGEARRFRIPTGEEFQFLHGRSEGIGVGAGAPRPVASSEKRDVVAEQKTQFALAQKSLAVQIAEAQAIRDAAVAWAEYTNAITPIEEQKLQNSLLAKKNDLVRLGMPDDVIEKEMQQFETQQKTALAIDVVNKMLRDKKIDAEEAAKKIAELNGNMATYNKLLGDSLALQNQQKFDQSMGALRKQMELAGIIDPRAELRASIAQENPGYSPEQVEQQAQAQERLEQLQAGTERLRGAASAMGDAFGEAFKGVLTGSASVQEALAGMFRSIADSFADMVSQMISQWMRAQVIGLFQNLLPGPGFGPGAPGSVAPNIQPGEFFSLPGEISTGMLTAANGAVWNGGFQAFANGGVVKGPTLGLVGEGRYNEAIVPLPDGKSIPVDLGGAASGNAAPINTNIVVNVKNGQAESQMTGNQGNQLARELEGAVRQVILKETRPGGLIPSSR
jgi:tape measure domain-containing protein